MPKNPNAILAFTYTWFLLPFPALLIADLALRKRWILDGSLRYYGLLAVAAMIVGGAWLVSVLATMPDSPEPPPWKPMLVMASFVGLIGGDLALLVGSAVGDSSPRQHVSVRSVRFAGVRVEFEVTTGPQQGLILSCGKQTWGPATGGERAFILHRGRLGLWWGEFDS
jgi:hypothetical protein